MNHPEEYDQKTCNGTYLAKNNYVKQLSVIQCLVDCDPGTLHSSMSVLSDEKSWYIDPDDVKKIEVHAIKMIFRKFDVKMFLLRTDHGTPYYNPITFRMWTLHLMANFNPLVCKVIMENHNLMYYVFQLIHLCQNNPDILNPSVFGK